MLAYTGHRDRLQHGRGGARPRRAGAEGGQPGADLGARHLRRHLGRSPSRRSPSPRTPPATTRPRSARPTAPTRCSASSRRCTCTAPLETAARWYVGGLAATILLIATNAGMIGISRLSWSLAEHRQLPGVFARLHPRFHTPWFTILFFAAIAIALVLPGNTDFLGNLYSFGAMLSFTIAHLSIVSLRVRRARSLPSLPRALERPLEGQRGPAHRGDRRARDRRRLRLRGRPAPGGADHRHGLDGGRARRLPPLPPQARARPARAEPGAAPAAPASGSSRSPTSRRWCPCSAPTSTRTRCTGPRRWSTPTPSSRPSTCSRCPPSTSCRRASTSRSTKRAACSTSPACRHARAG